MARLNLLSYFKKLYFCLIILYIPCLIAITFFYPVRERNAKKYEYHFIPLQTTIAAITSPAQYNTPGYWRIFAEGIAGNFLLFVPVGFFLRVFILRKNFTVLFYGVMLSVIIELTQLIFHVGVCDMDDVILNGLGTFAGIAFCFMVHRNYINAKCLYCKQSG